MVESREWPPPTPWQASGQMREPFVPYYRGVGSRVLVSIVEVRVVDGRCGMRHASIPSLSTDLLVQSEKLVLWNYPMFEGVPAQ